MLSSVDKLTKNALCDNFKESEKKSWICLLIWIQTKIHPSSKQTNKQTNKGENITSFNYCQAWNVFNEVAQCSSDMIKMKVVSRADECLSPG